MKHKDIQSKLILYLDGELPGKEVKEIKAHLENCTECAKCLDLISSYWKNESVEQESPSPFLWTRIERHINEYERKPVKGMFQRFIPNWNKAFHYVIVHPVTIALSIIAVAAGIYLGTPKVEHQSFNKSAVRNLYPKVTDEFGLNFFDINKDVVPGGELLHQITK